MSVSKKPLNADQALQKLRHFCGYQERCHSEARSKLFKLEISRKHHDAIIASLIEEGYLDEERFAIAFAGGKFRIKQWGKQKIKNALKQKQVSEYSINSALRKIGNEEYLSVLKKLADEKFSSLEESDFLLRTKKTMDYLVQKGFEAGLVNDALEELTIRDTNYQLH
jgi:regulatory protein